MASATIAKSEGGKLTIDRKVTIVEPGSARRSG
jgi:hypothetical protein